MAMIRTLRLHTPGADHEERKISWLELFYDLIYVATIIQLGNLLAADASPTGALLFTFLFVPVWWSWTSMMFFFNRFVADDPLHRVLVFVQMFAIASLAISVPGAFGETSVAFASSYFAIRVLLVAFYLRAWRAVPHAEPLIRRYALGFSAAASFWLLSVFVPPPYRYVLWVVGLAIEFYVPLSLASRRLQYLLPPDAGHFAERYGLFTIIVLGESFIKVVSGLADRGPTPDALVLTAIGFVIAACVWWLYFDHTHGGALRSTPSARYLWIYGHLPLTLGITGIGVGLKKLTLLPLGEPASDTVRWVVGGAVALCLVAFAMLDGVRTSHKAATVVGARVAAAATVMAVTAFGGGLPAVAVAALVAAVCVALVVLVERDQRASAHAAQPVADGTHG